MSTRYVAQEGAAARARALFQPLSLRRALGPGRMEALPQILALFIIAIAVALVVARMPINGRGDYGQWLMTSRYYLGEGVPDYRTITALPPLIPFLLAGLRLIVPDSGIALQTFNVVLLVALMASMYLVASAVFADRMAGLFAVALAFLVTDRYLELFAFGGLLQVGALVFTLISVAAFVLAGRYPIGAQRWWTLGSLSLALAALSHVGTGLLAVPVCCAVAAISAIRTIRRTGTAPFGSGRGDARRPWQWLISSQTVLRGMAGAIVIPTAVLAYWLLVLLPASTEYVSNPASLNYRGADRLLTALESYWPTILVMAAGVGALVIGGTLDWRRRRLGPWVVLAVWAAAVWATLLVSIVTQASTDYPRFATPLLAPLIVAGSGGLLWVSRWLAAFLPSRIPSLPRLDWRLAALAVVCLMGPLGFQRYANHVRFYQPLDAPGLTSVGAWLNTELSGAESVVAPVREGKWIEGVTGHPAVFSQPVRYTFRPIERERSLVADAIVRSTFAVASQGFFLKYSHGAPDAGRTVPRGMIVGANHRGEFLDLLQIPASAVRVIGTTSVDDTRATLLASRPVRMHQTVAENDATVSTTWNGTRHAGAGLSLNETTILHSEARTFELIEEVRARQPIGGVELQLWPLLPATASLIESNGQAADLYFPAVGLEEPHLRIEVLDRNGVITLGDDGRLTVRSVTDQVHLKVAALTTGEGGPDVQVLDPARLVDAYDVGAVLLVRYDPAFAARERRMEDLGFRMGMAAGAYALMVRD